MLVLSLALVVPFGATRVGAAVSALEYEVKAAYLLRFAQYVEWPDSALVKPNSPLIIGIIGSDPFGEVLRRSLRGRLAQGHPIQVRRFRTISEAASAHMLFFGRMDAGKRTQALQELNSRPVLTVGETWGFLSEGGGIALVEVDETVRFGVNLDAVRSARLKVSSRMLSLAESLDGAH